MNDLDTEIDTGIVDLSDPQKRAELLAVMREISSEMTKIEEARDQIKEIIDAAHSVFDLEKKVIRKVARFYHKRDISTFQTEASEISSVYSQLTATTAR